MIKLDYGSGRKPKENFLTSDFTGSPKYDFMIENYRISEIEDGGVSELHCRNVIHHIKPVGLRDLFDEFYRLLSANGTLTISEPTKENFHINRILDLIWYRHITIDESIFISDVYVDFKKYIDEDMFQLISREIDLKNEILIYKKLTN